MGLLQSLLESMGLAKVPERCKAPSPPRAANAGAGDSPLDRNQRVRRPRLKGLSSEQRKEQELRYQEALLERFQKSFSEDKARALSLGSTGYIWHSCGDGDVCKACSTRNGKRHRWDKPAAIGHPGTFLCSNGQPCRCYAEAIFPD